MKKEYNRMTTTDMPLDSSFTPTVEVVKDKKPAVQKPKINAIGKNTANKAKAGSKTTKTTSKSSTNSSSSKDVESKDKKLRTKLTKSDVELTDLEKLNDENIKQFRFKSKRNKVVIVLLSIMLAICVIFFSICWCVGLIIITGVCFIQFSWLIFFRSSQLLRRDKFISIKTASGLISRPYSNNLYGLSVVKTL